MYAGAVMYGFASDVRYRSDVRLRQMMCRQRFSSPLFITTISSPSFITS